MRSQLLGWICSAVFLVTGWPAIAGGQTVVTTSATGGHFTLSDAKGSASLLVSSTDYPGLIRVLEPGIVLQKIMIDTGGLKPGFLGAPQSEKMKM